MRDRRSPSGGGMATSRRWLRGLVGAAIGLIVGAIVAVNVQIFSGVTDGYQASLADVWDHSPFVALVIVGLWVAGPTIGVWFALRRTS
ncbi:MAG: hypothetical protein AB1Z55_10885 [Acidimicrobiia bacterium]